MAVLGIRGKNSLFLDLKIFPFVNLEKYISRGIFSTSGHLLDWALCSKAEIRFKDKKTWWLVKHCPIKQEVGLPITTLLVLQTFSLHCQKSLTFK
jgi:predicted membrane protein